jgi:DNA-binding response OmpR family regulator
MAPVLIVSHDPEVTSFVGSALRAAGYAPTTAASGREALVKAANGEYAAILIEVLMPDFDGIETILDLRKNGCQAPIIALSGQGRVVSAWEALNLARAVGADAALSKPFSEEEIANALSAALADKEAQAKI